MTIPTPPKILQPEMIGIACPDCRDGQLTARPNRIGKVFYACDQYPACKFASWKRPIALRCKQCGYPLHHEASILNFEFFKCSRHDCDDWIAKDDAHEDPNRK